MNSRSHVFLKPHAPRWRLRSLIQELAASGCLLPIRQHEDRIDFDVSACAAVWLAEGGLEKLFSNYADVVIWSAELYQKRPIIPEGLGIRHHGG